MSKRVIDVNVLGEPIDGTSIRQASEWAIAQGLMVNNPVVLRFPNGTLREGSEAEFTAKGLDFLAEVMKAGRLTAA